jgi:glycosyltransferase involved in cell wall biosynthesis
VPQKGYPDLLEAFAVIRRRFSSAVLLIAGDGPQGAELEARRASLGLEDSVHLLGARDDVPELLAAADVFVTASRWEGLPVAVLEAMAAGLPVVATAVGDVPNVLAEGAGVTVPPRDPAALAAAVCALLETPEERARVAAAAIARVRSRYSAARWAERLLELYAEVARPEPEPRAEEG